MGEVIFCKGGAHDPRVNTLLQVTNVDDGHITWVNGDEVTHVVQSPDGMLLSAWARLDVRRQVCEGCHDHDRDNHSAAKESDVWIAIHLLFLSAEILAEALNNSLNTY